MSRTVPLLAAALCAAVWLMAGPGRCLGAEAPPAEKKGDQEKMMRMERQIQNALRRIASKGKEIEEALDSPTQLEFNEGPLQDVIEYLKDAHGIEIQLDKKALDAAKIGTDSPVTANLKWLSLRASLSLMLAELKLTYVVQDEVLLITTIEDAKGRVTTKVYPVADLLPPGKQPEERSARCWELVRVVATTIAPETWGSGAAEMSPDVPSRPMRGVGRSAADEAAGSVGSAGGTGRAGSIVAATAGNVDVLVVTQSYHVHRQVAELLQELRKVAEGKQ